MKEVAQAIYSRFTASGALNASVGGRMYNTQAKQDATFPYIVFSFPTDVPEYTFNTEFENIRVQFSIFSTQESMLEVETIKGHLQALYDWCRLSVTGYFHVYMRRINGTLMRDDRPAWHRVVEYRVYIEKL